MGQNDSKAVRGETDLATDDGNRGQSFPQRERTITASIVTQHSTRPLYPIHQPDQALHRRHLSSLSLSPIQNPNLSSSLTIKKSKQQTNKAAAAAAAEKLDLEVGKTQNKNPSEISNGQNISSPFFFFFFPFSLSL